MTFEHLRDILRDHESDSFRKKFGEKSIIPSKILVLYDYASFDFERFDSLSRKYGNPNYVHLLNFHCWCIASPVNFSKAPQ